MEIDRSAVARQFEAFVPRHLARAMVVARKAQIEKQMAATPLWERAYFFIALCAVSACVAVAEAYYKIRRAISSVEPGPSSWSDRSPSARSRPEELQACDASIDVLEQALVGEFALAWLELVLESSAILASDGMPVPIPLDDSLFPPPLPERRLYQELRPAWFLCHRLVYVGEEAAIRELAAGFAANVRECFAGRTEAVSLGDATLHARDGTFSVSPLA